MKQQVQTLSGGEKKISQKAQQLMRYEADQYGYM